MTDERRDGEPRDGWVTGPELTDTEVLVTTLCRFEGIPVGHHTTCYSREARLHPDIECRTLFFQAEALRAGIIHLDGFETLPEEVRQHWVAGGIPTGTTHA